MSAQPTGFLASDRSVLRISGAEATKFLQNLVTNDVRDDQDGLIYTALLTPQGKYLADFFLEHRADHWLLDGSSDQISDLLRRLSLYKLRADVVIEPTDLKVWIFANGPGLPDPRNVALGTRLMGDTAPEFVPSDPTAYTALRIQHAIPAAGRELHPDDAYILEYGFERLNGVDFRKGCYVGQEVTARMKHKTELRKGLAQVSLSGAASEGDEITSNGKTVGRLHSIAGDQALAYLRFDRAGTDMQAGQAQIKRIE